MKKQILIIIVMSGMMLAAAGTSQAQDTRFGLKGGATMYSTTFSFGGFEDTSDNKLGFAAGLFVEKPFSEILSLQIEGLYIQKGGKDTDEEFGDGDVTLSYIDVPVLLKANIPVDGNVAPYAYAGGYAGYLLDATASGEGASEDISEFLKDLNYGVALGAGVSFGSLSLDIRYDLGLGNIYDDSSFADELGEFGEFFGGTSIEGTTSGFVLTAGISF